MKSNYVTERTADRKQNRLYQTDHLKKNDYFVVFNDKLEDRWHSMPVPNFESNSVLNQEVFQKQFSTDSESVHATFCSKFSDSGSDCDSESDSDFFLN